MRKKTHFFALFAKTRNEGIIMSEQNKKEFQTPYEQYRVKAGYTRESASEELNGISPDKIYRIEKGKQTAAQILFYN